MEEYIENSEDPCPEFSAGELHEALTGPMLKLRYQPIVRLSDCRPIGVEALARLDHPDHGMLAGEQFIPQMEAANLSPLLTEVMVTQATDDTCQHRLLELGLRIGLNIPLNVLLAEPIFDLLESQRQKCRIPATAIVLELTETQPVTDFAAVRNAVGRLCEIGYRVSIDDASPAMTDLETLLGLGFTTLKFDKSVVQSAPQHAASRDFLERNIRLAKAADMRTLAEGIETLAIQNLMREMGIDSGQGFLIGHPLPPTTVKLWLDAWQR
jgi:EAL domain-containing protein (putative c-di-GMP-specific phosphodiesterase class I)